MKSVKKTAMIATRNKVLAGCSARWSRMQTWSGQ